MMVVCRTLLFFILLIAEAASAQAQSLARTPPGHPDFQGTWTSPWLTPLERPPEASRLALTPAEADALFKVLWEQRDARDPLGPLESVDVRSLSVVGGETRSSLIVDPPNGRLPMIDPSRAPRPPPLPTMISMDGPEQRPGPERCAVSANAVAPLLVSPAGNIRQIVQTADYLVIQSETFSVTRIVPMTPGARAAPEAGRGRWDGDVLVIETAGFADSDRMRAGSYARFPVSPNTRIIERFRQTAPDEILYAFTVDDPSLYRAPWTAEMALRRSDQPVYEWACHEGNYALTNMLRAARILEQRTATQQKTKH